MHNVGISYKAVNDHWSGICIVYSLDQNSNKTEFVLDLHCDLQSKNGQLNPNNKGLDCLFLGPGLAEPAWL